MPIRSQSAPGEHGFRRGFGAAGVAIALALAAVAPASAAAAPANDAFADAQIVGAFPSTIGATNVDATKEPGEPAHAGDPGGHSIWFRTTVTTRGTLTVDTCDSDVDTLLAVYTGATVSALTPVASNNDSDSCASLGSRISFPVTPGTTYSIALDGAFEDMGAVSVTWSLQGPPANDAFAAAQVLTGYEPSASGSSVNASKEAGEPAHGGKPGGASVWYRWTAPGSGLATVSACSSRFDTLLGVYTGDAVGALKTVARNDDSTSCGTSRSEVAFFAKRGTVYRIAVDGAAGKTGRVVLAVLLPRTGRYSGRTEEPDRMPVSFTLASDGRTVQRFTFSSDLDCTRGGTPIGEVRLRNAVLGDPIAVRKTGTFATTVRASGRDGSRLTVTASGTLQARGKAKGRLSVVLTIPRVGTCKDFFGTRPWTARRP